MSKERKQGIYREIKNLINQNTLGKPITAHCLYTEKLFNSASHGIDIFHYWFGEEKDTITLKGYLPFLEDPAVDFILSYKSFDVFFQCNPDKDDPLFEIDIFFERGRIKSTSQGWDVRLHRKPPLDQDSKGVISAGKPFAVKPNTDRYQFCVIDGIYQNLTNGTEFVSDGESAFKTLQTCINVKTRVKKGAT